MAADDEHKGIDTGSADIFGDTSALACRVVACVDFGTSGSAVTVLDLENETVAALRRVGWRREAADKTTAAVTMKFGGHPEVRERESAGDPEVAERDGAQVQMVKFPTMVTTLNGKPTYMGEQPDIEETDMFQLFRYFKMCLSPERIVRPADERRGGTGHAGGSPGSSARAVLLARGGDGYPRMRRTESSTYTNLLAYPLDSDAGAEDKPVQLRQLIGLCLRRLKRSALSAGEALVGAKLSPSDVFWVLTVPSVWDEWAKRFMRQSAIESGFFANDSGPWTESHIAEALEVEAYKTAAKARLRFVREPVAAAIAGLWHAEERGVTLREGDQLAVVDCGGGTSDIAILAIKTRSPLKVTRVKAMGIPCGADRLDTAFKNKLCDHLLAEPLESGELSAVLEKWRNAKHAYAGHAETRITYLSGTTWAKLRPSNEMPDGFLRVRRKRSLVIPKSWMDHIFKELVVDILTAVVDLVGTPDNAHAIKAVSLVGGFGKSHAMKDGLRAVLSRKYPRMTVLEETDPQTAVVRGGVLMGAQLARPTPNPVVGHFSQPFTIGVDTVTIRTSKGLPDGAEVPDHAYRQDIPPHVPKQLHGIWTDVGGWRNSAMHKTGRPPMVPPMPVGWAVSMLDVALNKGETFKGTAVCRKYVYYPIYMEQASIKVKLVQLGRSQAATGTFTHDAVPFATLTVTFPSAHGSFVFESIDDKAVEVWFKVDSEGTLDCRMRSRKYPSLVDVSPRVEYASLSRLPGNRVISNLALRPAMRILGLDVGTGATVDDAKAAWRRADRTNPDVNAAIITVLSAAGAHTLDSRDEVATMLASVDDDGDTRTGSGAGAGRGVGSGAGAGAGAGAGSS